MCVSLELVDEKELKLLGQESSIYNNTSMSEVENRGIPISVWCNSVLERSADFHLVALVL